MKTVRWGMIGCGAVAEVKSGPGLYKAAHSALVAVSSRRQSVAEDYARRHGIGRVWATSEALVTDPAVDAVYIATPPASHASLTALAARAGKHVYVEKPMGIDADACRAMIEVCKANGVRLFVAYYRRALPRYLQVKQWLDAGAIGVPCSVRVVQHLPVQGAEALPGELPWRYSPELAGGGRFVDTGVHVLDMLDFWFGRIDVARGVATNRAGRYPVEDTVSAVWQHACGLQGVGSWCDGCREAEDRVTIDGSGGRIELAFGSDGPVRLTSADGITEACFASPQHVQQPFIQQIVDELIGGPAGSGSVEAALNTTRVVDDILRDYRRAAHSHAAD